LRTPRSAAVAGVLFALLYGAALVMIRLAFPRDITAAADWRLSNASLAATAVQLLAYAGIAFLWFMGVVRTRIGAREDRFLSTVFTGSGYLFLAMTFASGAVASGLLSRFVQLGAEGGAGDAGVEGGGFAVGARIAYELSNVYGIRMAGVFMVSLGTLCLRTGAMPRGFVWLTYLLALVLLLATPYTLWVTIVFPLWVLAFSVYLLIHGLGPEREPPPPPGNG
jgi:hypothetical protein